MDVNDILEKINQYFPVSPEQYLKDYLEKVQNTIVNCYEKEEYQMVHFNIYLLFMTYIYLVVYQTKTLSPRDHLLVIEYIRTYNNREKDLSKVEKIFEYSEVPDSEILKMLSLIGIDKATIGQYKGASKNRDPMAHATGYYIIKDKDEFESKTSTLLDYFEKINEKLLVSFKGYYLYFITQEIDLNKFLQFELIDKLNITNSEYEFLCKVKTNKLDENIKKRHREILKIMSEMFDFN